MKRYNRFFSFQQMEKAGLSGLASAIRNFAEAQDSCGSEWMLVSVHQDKDKNNENLYRATFHLAENDNDGYHYTLIFDCEVLNKPEPDYEFALIEKIDKNQSYINWDLR